MINIVFCDDNAQFLITLKALVERECLKQIPESEDYTVGPALGSGKELIEHIKKNHVDVLMLDIDMPDLNGFEIAKLLCQEYKHIKIVFMSAYDNLVYSTFEFYPFAYLRKSHISTEFPKILKRLLEKIREPERQLTLATTTGFKKIDVNSITYIESKRNYYSVHLIQGREYLCRGTLTEFEREVEKFDFYRIHSAYLVNFDHVEKMLENGFVLVSNNSLPIAQRRMQAFKKAYMSFIRRSLGT